ncbi:hypothetical protein [Phytohalomonas tamaricis]|uniref:hypothetical protein n=1 Tax=Phytohalomonas tamaricis TaxID=2081032 RepID=UPI000D0B2064|nr:hypothetical protein [Phytohalomonas tamaricis]
MNIAGLRTVMAGLLAATLIMPAYAGPRDGHGGPRGPDHYQGPGPRHGHGLPNFARELWIGSALYFIAAGTYYLWNANTQRYEAVAPPPAVQQSDPNRYDVIAYPAHGQTQEQQSKDRYECHSWAVSQSGFDPASAQQAPAATVADTYRRALSACLTGRGYSVN